MPEDNDDRQSAEGVLKRAGEQLAVLGQRGIDTQSLNKRLEQAQMSFASGDYHDAELAAGEVIVLAKATAEMARMSANVAKQEDATRQKVAEAVKAELAKGLPQSPALEAYLTGRFREMFEDLLSGDEFQQAVLGLAGETFNNLSEENETVTRSEMDQRISVAEERATSEASTLVRQAIAGLLNSSELVEKIDAGARSAADTAVSEIPRFTEDDAQAVAEKVARKAISALPKVTMEDVESSVRTALGEAGYASAEKVAEDLAALEEVVKESAISNEEVTAVAQRIADTAAARAVASMPGQEDLEKLAEETKAEVEQRLSAFPSPEEVARSAAEAAHEEIVVLSKEIRKQMNALSSTVESVAGREVVSPAELEESVGGVKEKLREELISFAGRVQEKAEELAQENQARIAALKDEVAAAAAAVETLDEMAGGLAASFATKVDLGGLEETVNGISATVTALEARIGSFPEEVADKEDVAGVSLGQSRLSAKVDAIEEKLGILPEEAARQEDLVPINNGLANISSELKTLEKKISILPPEVVSRDEYLAAINQFQETIGAVESAQASLALRSEVEEVLGNYVPAEALRTRVNEIIRPQIEETRSSIPEVEAVRDIARVEAENAASKVPVFNPQDVEERVMDKVAPMVGALVGSDQFISNIEMIISQRINDVIDGKGLASVDTVEKLLDNKVSNAAKKFVTDKELAEVKKTLLKRGGEVDISAAVEALKAEMGTEKPLSPDAVKSLVAEAVHEALSSGEFAENLGAAQDLSGVDEMVKENVAVAVSMLRKELKGFVQEAAAGQEAPVNAEAVGAIVEEKLAAAASALRDELMTAVQNATEAAAAGVDAKEVEGIVAKIVGESTPSGVDEAAVHRIIDESGLVDEAGAKFIAAEVVSHSAASADEEKIKNMVEETVAQNLGEFFHRLPKSPQLKGVIKEAVAAAAPAEGHATATVDPDALRPVILQIVQDVVPAQAEGGGQVDPESLRPVIEGIVKELAPAAAGVPEDLSQTIESELLGFLSDPEYIKNLIPVPDGLDVEKIEKIAKREGMQAVIQIFDSDEFAKRVAGVVGEGGGGGGGGLSEEALQHEVRGAMVELMESDLFMEKINMALMQQGAGGGEGGAGGAGVEQVASMIKETADQIRSDLAERMEKVEKVLPDIVGKIVAEKGGGADPKLIEEQVTAIVADKVLGDKLDPEVIQAEIKNQTPEVVREIANSDEFKVLLDDKFKVILNYLKQDVIPKQVKKLMKNQ
ncbi:MAG: hypothetical protein JW909_00375 [Planctomycetes bacterium]|nr:hypothetical protein [Planctomycetota bacterium]